MSKGVVSVNESTSITNVSEIVNFNYYIFKDGMKDFGNYYKEANDYQRVAVNLDDNEIVLYIRTAISTGYTIVKGGFILDYTKTTD